MNLSITQLSLLAGLLGMLFLFLPVKCEDQEEYPIYEWQSTLSHDGELVPDRIFNANNFSLELSPIIRHDIYDERNEDATFLAIQYSLTNNSDNTLRVHWDESSIVTPGGAASQLAPGDIQCFELGQRDEILPTIVPSQSTIYENILLPVALFIGCSRVQGEALQPSGSELSLLLAIKSGAQVEEIQLKMYFERVESGETISKCISRSSFWNRLWN